MSQNFEDTILALSTGSLRAATALIRISGNSASSTANILGFKAPKQKYSIRGCFKRWSAQARRSCGFIF